MLDTILTITLVLNILWFAGGFNLFAMRGHIFAKVVIPKEQRDTPVLDVLVMSGKFLGGFNLAFCVLSLLLIFNTALFDQPLQWTVVLFATAVAHATQFAYNVPVFLANRKGGGIWKVEGLMRFIFVTDFSLAALNFGLAAYFAFGA